MKFYVRLWIFVNMIGISFLNATLISAKEKKKEPVIDRNPFNYIKGNEISTNAEIRGTAVSWNRLMMAIAVVLMAITMVFSALRYGFAKGTQNHNEAKDKISFILVVAVVIFSFSFFVGLVMEIVTTMSC